jgi:Kdo2-lipid IVA lauroyltransferase/acyltransferase
MTLRNIFLKLLLNILSSLPFWLLYLFSDFLAFFMKSIVRYRRKVVFQNISNSFPEKNDQEIKQIAAQFYRNLADLIVELIKSQKLSDKELMKRVQINETQIFDDLYNKKKSVIITLGHCGNWEWAGNRIAMFLQHNATAIYKPLSDKFFNDYLFNQRQKYKGTLMIDYKKTFRILAGLRNELLAVFMLADQSPARTEINYWAKFLGQATPFYTGMGKLASALGYTVIYLDIQRRSRGNYIVDVQMIEENAANTSDFAITNKYINLLENSIINHPDNWLWSHRRWKFNKEEPAY